MTVSEILKEIHKAGAEVEVYKALHYWVIEDRRQWMGRAAESEATVRAAYNLATRTKNKKGALEGIASLCSKEREEN